MESIGIERENEYSKQIEESKELAIKSVYLTNLPRRPNAIGFFSRNSNWNSQAFAINFYSVSYFATSGEIYAISYTSYKGFKLL